MGVINQFQAKKMAIKFLFLADDFVRTSDQVAQKREKCTGLVLLGLASFLLLHFRLF